MSDYPNRLHNLLQGHPTGNLTQYLHYAFTQEDSDGVVVHIATVIFRGEGYGVGRGRSKSAARQNAARATYEQFSTGVPGT